MSYNDDYGTASTSLLHVPRRGQGRIMSLESRLAFQDQFTMSGDGTWVPKRQSSTTCTHPNPVDDGECWEGCCDKYRCPDCGHRWRVEHDG